MKISQKGRNTDSGQKNKLKMANKDVPESESDLSQSQDDAPVYSPAQIKTLLD